MSNSPQIDPAGLIPDQNATGITGIRAYQIWPAIVNVADPVAQVDNKLAFLSVDSAGRLRSLVTAVSGSQFTTVPFSAARTVLSAARAS